MTEKDLFNAINDIDEKQITNAWNNTAFDNEPIVIRSSGRGVSKAAVFGTVAAFAGLISAACLAVFIRVNTPPRNNVIDDPDSSASRSGTASNLMSGNELPFDLFGPDYVQIKYSDITGAHTSDGTIVKAADFDPDDWSDIICGDFTYLAQATANNFNSIDSPEKFDGDEDALLGFDFGSSAHTYKRYNTGDKFGGLTVKSAYTMFKNISGTTPSKLGESYVRFDGTAVVDAYIIREENGTFLKCVPMNREFALPVMSMKAQARNEFYTTRYSGSYSYGEFKYSTHYPNSFTLVNGDDFNTDRFFNGKNYAAVTLTLSDIQMAWNADDTKDNFILAEIDEIEAYSGGVKGDLPFELYGADNKQITFEDIDDIIDNDGNRISNDELTADNWSEIVCNDTCYLKTNTGSNYNSIDNPEMFDPKTGEFIGDASDASDYKRYEKGDSFNGLRIYNAYTYFKRKPELAEADILPDELSAAQQMYFSYIYFDGRMTIDAYIIRGEYSDTVTCVPLNGEEMPVMFMGADDDGGYVSQRFTGTTADGFGYSAELPVFYLHGDNNVDFERYLNGNDYAKVRVTFSNVHIQYYRNVKDCCIQASVESIGNHESTGLDADITGNLPFDLYGPDHKQLHYEDIANVTDNYGNPLKLTELTEDNWSHIECSFAYISKQGTDGFRRYNIGDSVMGLTVTSATAYFDNNDTSDEAQSAAMKYSGCEVEFGGTLEFNTTLMAYKDKFCCVNTQIPRVSFNSKAQTWGSFLPIDSEPALNLQSGFFDENSYSEPTITVDSSMLSNEMIARLINKERIPVTVSLTNIKLSTAGNSVEVYRIIER